MSSPALVQNRLIDEMVRRIVDRFDPEKVILFGSWARGTAGPDSDVDLLVVLGNAVPKRKKRVQIREALHGIGVAKDIAVVSSEELERLRDIPGTIAFPAAREGLLLYERGT